MLTELQDRHGQTPEKVASVLIGSCAHEIPSSHTFCLTMVTINIDQGQLKKSQIDNWKRDGCICVCELFVGVGGQAKPDSYRT